MVEPSPSLIAAELRAISDWHYQFASGTRQITVEHARIIEGVLRMLAADCERLGEELAAQLAVARRWAPGAESFVDHFAREKAVQAGVRDGSVIDLVPVLEREMARNAALRGGAAS
jgi:hypothetical protein